MTRWDRLRSSNGWIYLFDAGGERVAKFPDNPILRREMVKLVIQVRNEAKSSTACYVNNPAVDAYYDDVACSDPDRRWIEKAAVGLSGSLVYEGRGHHVAGLLPSGGCR